jgi:prepilin-type N-terminal cleavage/methylation domain-containing protein
MIMRSTGTSRPRHGGFTLAELMAALIIFALVSMAGTYLMAALGNTRQYVQSGTTSDSEVAFATQRITENIRAATAVSFSASSLTITSPPSALISGGTFTITYSVAGTTLVEICTNNTSNQTYSSGVLVHNVQQFSVTQVPANTKAFQIVLGAGTTMIVQRTFVAFGRNL